jgi:crotonobetainyl-CoA:carnitine CoA-transferase CaiB-like acyl-CoA transferase
MLRTYHHRRRHGRGLIIDQAAVDIQLDMLANRTDVMGCVFLFFSTTRTSANAMSHRYLCFPETDGEMRHSLVSRRRHTVELLSRGK